MSIDYHFAGCDHHGCVDYDFEVDDQYHNFPLTEYSFMMGYDLLS